MTPEQRSLWRYLKRCEDFDRYIRRLGLVYSFLTLTQSDLSVETGAGSITGVMNEMGKVFRKLGLPFGYISTLEIQPKRYASFGVFGSHWHIAVAYPEPGSLPHTAYDKNGARYHKYVKVRDGSIVTFDWLEGHWRKKIGQYFCCDGFSWSIKDYLGKYIGKQDPLLKELKKRLGCRVRVFSSSRFPLEDQLNWFHKGEFEKEIAAHPDLAGLYWRRENSSIVGRGKEVQTYTDFDGKEHLRVRYPRVRVIHGEWVRDSG